MYQPDGSVFAGRMLKRPGSGRGEEIEGFVLGETSEDRSFGSEVESIDDEIVVGGSGEVVGSGRKRCGGSCCGGCGSLVGRVVDGVIEGERYFLMSIVSE